MHTLSRMRPTTGKDSPSPVIVLGVSGHYHDAAAALLINGDIVAAAQEERFTRRKFDPRLPESAIDYVLREAGIGPQHLTAVAWYESPFAKFDRLASTSFVGQPRAIGRFTSSMRTWLPKKLWVGRQLGDLLGRSVPVLYCDHHLSHAASAFYPSGFDHAAVVTVDGVGEWSTTTIGIGTDSGLELVEHIEYPNSLGLLYSAFTLYCGFTINSGEYKLMGLAPYGTPRFTERILSEMVHLHDDGSFSLNPALFDFFHANRTYGAAFERFLGAPSRRDGMALTQHYADVAASIQAVCDQAVLGLARRARAVTNAPAIVLAGGVALNVVSVGALERSALFEHVWVQPAAGDAGGALGAALWATHQVLDVPRTNCGDAMHGAFLGPTPGDVDISVSDALELYGLVSTELSDDALAEQVAAHIVEGDIVGVARGRMEFGPRALGNRSILADARDPDMQRRLNIATKLREGFRPFAPIVLRERADDWFVIDGRESPYMLKTYLVREHRRGAPSDIDTPLRDDAAFHAVARQVRSTIPSVTHVDYSARVQTVDEERHPFTHRVLRNFDAATGCPVLVNTSFNVRGEPIVASAVDAIECFLHVDIDVLVLENHLIRKHDQSPAALQPRRALAARKD